MPKDSLTAALRFDSELEFWFDQGLTAKHVQNWSQEFGLELKSIIRSLRYCAFDLVANNQQQTKGIRSPLNWIYRILERSGGYPKPYNYRDRLR